MLSPIDDRDLLESSVLGNYDIFQQEVSKYYSVPNPDVFQMIYNWNCSFIKDFICESMVDLGLELICENRIFVIASNPKTTRNEFPWRCTHYIRNRGPLYDESYKTVECAIIDVFLNYPRTIKSNATLDEWHKDFQEINNNPFNVTFI